jgi:3-phosphoshikimate 1-carboxyvinyltransferase
MSDSPVTYPDRIEIAPLTKPPLATVRVPGSKSITNRALVLAALNNPVGCELEGALLSEDTEMMMGAMRRLGFYAAPRRDLSEPVLKVFSHDRGRSIPSDNAELFVGNSGTTMRFLTAMLGLGHGRYRLDGVPRMRERPIEDLLSALRQLGVSATAEKENGCPPVVIEAKGLRGGHVKVKSNVSSQFLSGLLMAAPFADGDVVIEVEGELVSQPYVGLTLAMMRQCEKVVEILPGPIYRVPGRQKPSSEYWDYLVEPDASAASYFWAAAAVCGGHVTVPGLTGDSLQGDVRFVDLLEEMGCTIVRSEEGITVHGGPLCGIDVDMNDISDTVMTLGAVALFADGPTTIRNVAHIRHKETDRLAALAAELRRVGPEVEEFADGLRITPRPLHGAQIETYNDHRMAMSMSLVGLKVPGVVIKDPGCVAKTYPNFFSDLEKLRDDTSPR